MHASVHLWACLDLDTSGHMQAASRLQAEAGHVGALRTLCNAYLDAWARLHPPLAFLPFYGAAGDKAPVGIVRGGPLMGLLLPGGRPSQVRSRLHVSPWSNRLGPCSTLSLLLSAVPHISLFIS